MRGRLIELIETARYWSSGTSVEVADYLLANGVVVVDTEVVSLENRPLISTIADYPIDEVISLMKAKEEGRIIVPPCKVGDTVYYVNEYPLNLAVQANKIYEAKVVRITTSSLGTTIVIQIHNDYGCTEIPDVNDWGKTVFPTREEAEQASKGGEQE